MYFNLAKILNKTVFHLYNLLFLLSVNGAKYEIVTEMWPFKTTLTSSPFQDVNLQKKNPDL